MYTLQYASGREMSLLPKVGFRDKDNGSMPIRHGVDVPYPVAVPMP